ncbi:hypothetical protein [Dactylosporangium cerinum]
MDPSREPRSTAARPADDAVVAYLRDRAPGLPAVVFDPGSVTSRARRALRLRRRRRRTSVAIATARWRPTWRWRSPGRCPRPAAAP